MPLSQNPIVEWPTEIQHLLQGLEIVSCVDGKRYGRIDVDVGTETLFLLNDFEARVRHRQVRLRPNGANKCLLGEMNVLIGLGASANPIQHIAKVRISFHDIRDDDCTDPTS